MEWCLMVVSIVTILGLAYLKASAGLWAVTFFLTLGVIQIYGVLSASVLFGLWTFLILTTILFNVTVLRQTLLVKYLLNWAKKRLPTISLTEQEAMDAGDVWWEGDLFQGRPDWEKFLTLSKSTLTVEEEAFLQNPVQELCRMLDDWEITHKLYDLPPKVWNFLKEKKFFGMIIPKDYGGLEFSALAHSTIVQKIATRSLTTAITTMVPNSLGPAELLMNYGTESQKQYYLPRLAQGDEIPCFALTSLEAGSDAGAIEDIGIVCKGEYQGVETLGIRLTWDKRYITLAPVATVLGLAFKLYDPEKLLSNEEFRGVTVCLIPTTHPGVEIGQRHFPLNQGFMNGPTRGKDVFVPLDWIIGGSAMIGRGWHMLVECLSAGRGISLPALSTAIAKLSYRTTGAYARVRKQFNTSIGEFEGVQSAMAKIAGFTYMMEAARLLTLTAIDDKKRPAILTAMAKYHLTEMGRLVINHAMDIHGGKAIMLGPNNYLGRGYESIPISVTVEGANILTRNLIIFGQGAIRCHPYIQEEMKALKEKDESKAINAFDKALFAHIQYFFSNLAKCIVHSFTLGFFSPSPANTKFRCYYKKINKMSMAFALVSDIALMMLGGKLKRSERLSARLGDVLSYLYLGSAVLKYCHDFGGKEDEPFVKWCLSISLYNIQEAFYAFFKNFPNKPVSFILRFLTFPFGRMYRTPNDILEHQLASEMMKPSSFRDRLTMHCYNEKVKNNPLADLENALEKMINAEDAISKLGKALKKQLIPKHLDLASKIKKAVSLKILTEEEAEEIHGFEALRIKVLKVDEFSHQQLIGNKI